MVCIILYGCLYHHNFTVYIIIKNIKFKSLHT
nr:MAG TPA: hypothetical protein [Caudoviricetes sp.]